MCFYWCALAAPDVFSFGSSSLISAGDKLNYWQAAGRQFQRCPTPAWSFRYLVNVPALLVNVRVRHLCLLPCLPASLLSCTLIWFGSTGLGVSQVHIKARWYHLMQKKLSDNIFFSFFFCHFIDFISPGEIFTSCSLCACFYLCEIHFLSLRMTIRWVNTFCFDCISIY